MGTFSGADVAELQALLLRASILRAPLPGQEHSLSFPDMAAALEPPPPRLSTEHLVASDEIADVAGIRVELITPDALPARAAERGPFGYLRYQAPEVREDRIQLSLQACTAFPDLEPLPMGAIVASFARDTSGDWTTLEPTAALGY